MDLEIEPVDIGAVLDAVATVVEPAAEAKGLRVDVVVARDLPRIETDPRHLRQILLNLVANAIKFTERGAVTVVAKRDANDNISIDVEDTGIGIADGDIDRIFEEFEQVRPSGRGDSMQRGTGLGLAIARKLARLLGGEVVVASQLGRGSCFTLTLPSAIRTTPSSGIRAIPDESAATAEEPHRVRSVADQATPNAPSSSSALLDDDTDPRAHRTFTRSSDARADDEPRG